MPSELSKIRQLIASQNSTHIEVVFQLLLGKNFAPWQALSLIGYWMPAMQKVRHGVGIDYMDYSYYTLWRIEIAGTTIELIEESEIFLYITPCLYIEGELQYMGEEFINRGLKPSQKIQLMKDAFIQYIYENQAYFTELLTR